MYELVHEAETEKVFRTIVNNVMCARFNQILSYFSSASNLFAYYFLHFFYGLYNDPYPEMDRCKTAFFKLGNFKMYGPQLSEFPSQHLTLQEI